MDVTDPLLDRLGKDRIQQPYDRRFVGQVQQVLRLPQFGGDGGKIDPFQFLQHFAGCSGNAGIDMIYQIGKNHVRHQHRFHRLAEQHAQLIQQQDSAGPRDSDPDSAIPLTQRQDRIAAGKGQRNTAQQPRVNLFMTNLSLERYSKFEGNRLQLFLS